MEVEIYTTSGVIQCRLSRVEWYGAQVMYADMWRIEQHLDSSYIAFRAAVHLEWTGDRYKIIQPSRKPYNNAFWKELENLLSNTIIVNE